MAFILRKIPSGWRGHHVADLSIPQTGDSETADPRLPARNSPRRPAAGARRRRASATRQGSISTADRRRRLAAHDAAW